MNSIGTGAKSFSWLEKLAGASFLVSKRCIFFVFVAEMDTCATVVFQVVRDTVCIVVRNWTFVERSFRYVLLNLVRHYFTLIVFLILSFVTSCVLVRLVLEDLLDHLFGIFGGDGGIYFWYQMRRFFLLY